MSRFSVVPASYVYLLDGDRVLLQRRQNTGYMDGTWAASAAGHIEAGETAQAAAVREVAEELEVRIEPSDLVPSTVMQRTDGTNEPREQRVDWFFTCRRWAGEPRIAEPHKNAELAWYRLDALPPALSDYERLALGRVAAGANLGLVAYGF